MTTYTIPIPDNLAPLVTPDMPQAVTEYLAAHGIAVEWVSVQREPTLALVLSCDADPTAALGGYAGEASAARQALLDHANAALAFAAAVEGGQTVTAPQAFAALAATIRVLQWAVQRNGGL